jgi:hypothetical protein
MATYDHKQVLVDYEKGKLTPEMAVGHSLQHIDQLYALLKTGKLEWQNKSDTQEKRVNALQVAVDRLTAIIEKARSKQKRTAPSQSKPEQP